MGNQTPRWDTRWAVFPGEIEGRQATYFVDLGALAVAPVQGLPVRLDVEALLPDTDEYGLPTAPGQAAVQQLEAEVTEVSQRQGGAYVGGVLLSGMIRLTCYLPAPPAEAVQLRPTLTTSVGTAEDPAWEYLRTALAPDDRQRHIADDREVINALTAQGDPLEIARPVDHTSVFPTQAAAEAAAAELTGEGFDFRLRQHQSGATVLEVVRADPVHPPYVHQLTWAVRDCVERHGGSYDGWSCTVMR